MFEGLAKIEKLRLCSSENIEFTDDILSVVGQLSELTHLELAVDAIEGSELVRLIQCAPKLCELGFVLERYIYTVIDENVYNEILAVLATRRDICPLEMIFYNEEPEEILYVPIEMSIANEDKLKIKFSRK